MYGNKLRIYKVFGPSVRPAIVKISSSFFTKRHSFFSHNYILTFGDLKFFHQKINNVDKICRDFRNQSIRVPHFREQIVSALEQFPQQKFSLIGKKLKFVANIRIFYILKIQKKGKIRRKYGTQRCFYKANSWQN